MLRHRLAAAAFLASILPAAASAQDPEPQAAGKPQLAPQGIRIELLAGYDDSWFGNGAVYGGRIGYDLRIARRISIGVDGELTGLTTDRDIKPFSTIVVGDGPDAYGGLRLTVGLTRRLNIYGIGGYTEARLGHFELGPGNSFIGVRQNYSGWRLGGGAQLSLGRHAFVGAEYRHSQYDPVQKHDQYVATVGFRF